MGNHATPPEQPGSFSLIRFSLPFVVVLRNPAEDGSQRLRAITPQQPDLALLPLLEDMGVTVTAEAPETPSLLLSFLPWILLLACYFWHSRRMMGGGGSGISGGLPGGIGDFLNGCASKPAKPLIWMPSQAALAQIAQSRLL